MVQAPHIQPFRLDISFSLPIFDLSQIFLLFLFPESHWSLPSFLIIPIVVRPLSSLPRCASSLLLPRLFPILQGEKSISGSKNSNYYPHSPRVPTHSPTGTILLTYWIQVPQILRTLTYLHVWFTPPDSLIPFDLTYSYPSFRSPLRHHSHQKGFLDFLLSALSMNASGFLKLLGYSSHRGPGMSFVFLCIAPLAYPLQKGPRGSCVPSHSSMAQHNAWRAAGLHKCDSNNGSLKPSQIIYLHC